MSRGGDASRQFDLCTARRIKHDEVRLLGELRRPVLLGQLLDVAGAAAAAEHVVVAGRREGWEEQCGCETGHAAVVLGLVCLFVSLSM